MGGGKARIVHLSAAPAQWGDHHGDELYHFLELLCEQSIGAHGDGEHQGNSDSRARDRVVFGSHPVAGVRWVGDWDRWRGVVHSCKVEEASLTCSFFLLPSPPLFPK